MKQGILAFENMKMRHALHSLNQINNDNLETFLEIFNSYKDIEVGVYYTIISQKLKIIQSLKEKIQNNEKERILQEHIFDNLWLLDPSWERGTQNAQMEEVIQVQAEKESDKIKKGRIDIHYRKTAGEHLIIELKRTSVNITLPEIISQLDTYKMALKDKLKLINKENEIIECIFICGKLPRDWQDLNKKKEDQDALKAKRIRLLTYDELIEQSYNAYKEYMDEEQESARILKILKEIDQMQE
ncbi:hypothetical protein LNU06_01670 [Campylobacter sp. VicNov18]|uniref:hypothetical protein n=1 Tax=Campylobacter bilis TaxID=2691918 RepID=UPI00130D6A18|nr:hypothetical protein [Campylobacter bilis]MPV63371.1 hypothetical protein [Campylobacter hepaticus]MBM0636870.1 hypothetical protein [Campylobacter bilis]MCC8277578.1 hypothetical protein [Campylobacter bilis]MCC8299187.1 hypothetical protein [Campylobacter bilis]MCC8300487.1 hypothetical protein [Campylobacter bilis]